MNYTFEKIEPINPGELGEIDINELNLATKTTTKDESFVSKGKMILSFVLICSFILYIFFGSVCFLMNLDNESNLSALDDIIKTSMAAFGVPLGSVITYYFSSSN